MRKGTFCQEERTRYNKPPLPGSDSGPGEKILYPSTGEERQCRGGSVKAGLAEKVWPGQGGSGALMPSTFLPSRVLREEGEGIRWNFHPRKRGGDEKKSTWSNAGRKNSLILLEQKIEVGGGGLETFAKSSRE